MKTLYIVIGSIVVFFIIAQFFIHRSSTKIEFYPYTVAKLVGEIEIRDYQARLFTNVPLANLEEIPKNGIYILFKTHHSKFYQKQELFL